MGGRGTVRAREIAVAALALAAGVATGCSHPPLMQPSSPSLSSAGEARGVAKLRRDAAALAPLVEAPWVKDFLRATAALPSVKPRVVYEDRAKGIALTEDEAKKLDASARAQLHAQKVDDDFYYATRYGSPLAYARVFDLIAKDAKVDGVDGKRLLDFGYGGIGHLRLLASLGADVVGVDVDPLLRVLYGGPTDQGRVKGWDGHHEGSLRLVDGEFPATPAVRAAVGGGFHGIVSKNTLKRGYIHPSEPTDERKLIHLGVDDATFVRALFDALEPGGFVMIYNIGPAPAPPGKPYIPWADIRSPFAKEAWEAAGFRVVVLDRDDTQAARAQARALGWDKDPEEPTDIDHDVFAMFTLLTKP